MREDFDLLYSTDLPANGPPSSEDRGELFDVAADPNYNEQAFAQALPPTADLYRELQSNGDARSDFNLLYGTDLQSSGAPDEMDRGELFGVAADPSFKQDAFIAVADKAADLLTALQDDTAKLSNYNETFGTSLPEDGPPSDPDRTQLFNLTGDPNFNQDALIGSL